MPDIRLPIEDGISNDIIKFDETDDFGGILRTLRLNHGLSIVRLSKMIGLQSRSISLIEHSEKELPNEQVLRTWLDKLGCKENKNYLMRLAKQHKVVHYLKLHSKDPSNPDMIRLIYSYRDKALTEFDRHLLSLIGRDSNPQPD